jgi:hypothetical protein
MLIDGRLQGGPPTSDVSGLDPACDGGSTRRHENLRLASAGGLVALLVLVVPADPELPGLALIASLRCVVEDRVVAHQKLHAAARR